MSSFPECVTWLAVGLTECVAVVTLNIITIILCIKNRNLRKRSMYLIINLAVSDMLVGVVATYDLFYSVGADCDVWKYNLIDPWAEYVLGAIISLFPVSSLTNIAAISVERLHATLWPFRHRLIKKWVYALIIAVVWVTTGLLSIALGVLFEVKGPNYYSYLLNSFVAICLLVTCISYPSIIIKVRCRAQPRHHGAASRERKLTMTLLIVTVVSLLLYLPYTVIVYVSVISEQFKILTSKPVHYHLGNAIMVLFYANSLVNPILYAIRIPEYRSAVLALFRRRPQQQRQVAVIPLHDM